MKHARRSVWRCVAAGRGGDSGRAGNPLTSRPLYSIRKQEPTYRQPARALSPTSSFRRRLPPVSRTFGAQHFPINGWLPMSDFVSATHN
ncbi:hypothetical protein E4T49_03599 [Aureobasidium sp. EXF-10728]|nr:hypothetical protein E4T49_03599 [Aureobasidium sp. EXF-10728]